MRVPKTNPEDEYAAAEDNIAPVSTGNSKKTLILDFSKVAESKVDPTDLKMTVIKGFKLATSAKVKDRKSVTTTGGVKAKVNKKTLIATITCKKSGTASFTMEDGSKYTVAFTAEKPKAQKSQKNIQVGNTVITKTVSELFGTRITAGTLSITKQKQSQATISDNALIIKPEEKDDIKLQYQYLNRKYRMTVKVR